MTDSAYFDYILFKLGIEKIYMQYLPAKYLKAILILGTPGITYKKLAEKMNEDMDYSIPLKESSARELIKNAVRSWHKLVAYGRIFGIEESIRMPSIEELHNKVISHYKDIDDLYS